MSKTLVIIVLIIIVAGLFPAQAHVAVNLSSDLVGRLHVALYDWWVSAQYARVQ